ncbi:pyrroline-5-carboxylate reductase [uncultured Clostridium sp.]|uniref:pyrroline-5-carboxylate reductase n=1 Tax=uncultured Clostridium sp. TaxID=59620 RepID=UPI0026081616|nr:pyrroline-5-carboxylate reductase [uncultured Clostridium sp.]
MNKKIGFIGCGNMGGAMLGSLVENKFIEPSNILVSTKREESRKNLEEKYGVVGKENNKDVAKNTDIIFLAVKPYMYKEVIEEIKEDLKGKIIVSIAAGINMSDLEKYLGDEEKIIKTMPNTPALVGAGMSAICPNNNVSEDDLKEVCEIFNVFGKYEILEEKDFHAFIALCGSSPAYIFMIIEAMADGAVKLGIARDKAYKMAAQSVLGSAKMVLETGMHPGVLKDMVCSPGGTTIAAVAELEEKGIRNTMISAIDKCAEKSKNM